MRTAVISHRPPGSFFINPSLVTVQQYLPSNYTATLEPVSLVPADGDQIVITGEDREGYALHDVIGRLAGAMIFAEEIRGEDEPTCACPGRAGGRHDLICGRSRPRSSRYSVKRAGPYSYGEPWGPDNPAPGSSWSRAAGKEHVYRDIEGGRLCIVHNVVILPDEEGCAEMTITPDTPEGRVQQELDRLSEIHEINRQQVKDRNRDRIAFVSNSFGGEQNVMALEVVAAMTSSEENRVDSAFRQGVANVLSGLFEDNEEEDEEEGEIYEN